MDVIPEMRTDDVSETQLIITQKALDCEQFVQARAQKLCLDAQLEFLHLDDYDINLLYVSAHNFF